VTLSPPPAHRRRPPAVRRARRRGPPRRLRRPQHARGAEGHRRRTGTVGSHGGRVRRRPPGREPSRRIGRGPGHDRSGHGAAAAGRGQEVAAQRQGHVDLRTGEDRGRQRRRHRGQGQGHRSHPPLGADGLRLGRLQRGPVRRPPPARRPRRRHQGDRLGLPQVRAGRGRHPAGHDHDPPHHARRPPDRRLLPRHRDPGRGHPPQPRERPPLRLAPAGGRGGRLHADRHRAPSVQGAADPPLRRHRGRLRRHRPDDLLARSPARHRRGRRPPRPCQVQRARLPGRPGVRRISGRWAQGRSSSRGALPLHAIRPEPRRRRCVVLVVAGGQPAGVERRPRRDGVPVPGGGPIHAGGLGTDRFRPRRAQPL
ncbi:MAG: hypothetical protein AVDCRST_MAG10-1262, partial [uncultured Acidimicrobiales bacterium]